MNATPAERLDRAVDLLLGGHPPAAGPALRPLIEVAAYLRGTLVPVPPSHAFEERLASQLRRAASVGRRRRELMTPHRLLLTGAVGSAVGVAGVAAFAAWRAARR
jgi:hypothetical protein